ncbi:MAG: type III pantothenate kinase [Cognaticolwellia sp.]
MRLLVDVGNSQVKYMLQDSDALSEIVYLDYQAFLLQLSQGAFDVVQEVILANVHGSEIPDAVQAWATAQAIVFLQVHSEATAFGISSAYSEPERLGVDRWLAMVGAQQLYPQQNVLIIDAGTATTVDILDAQGQHLGGWIMPGVQTLFDSIVTRTQKISAQPNAIAALSFGDNSSMCVNHGSWAMTIGAVKEAILQVNTLLTLDKILLTGGNGKQIANFIGENCQLEPRLVFQGLSRFQAS